MPFQKMSLQCHCQVQRLCFGKDLFTYAYRHIYEELFSKTWSANVALAFATSIFGFALNTFWKRALHIYIYMHTHNKTSKPTDDGTDFM